MSSNVDFLTVQNVSLSFGGNAALSDVSFDGETLKFNRSGPQGQMTMAFKVAGDTISGTLNTPGGELPVTGKRSS